MRTHPVIRAIRVSHIACEDVSTKSSISHLECILKIIIYELEHLHLVAVSANQRLINVGSINTPFIMNNFNRIVHSSSQQHPT